MKNKFIALLLVLMLVFGLAGCGTQSSESEESSQETQEATQETSSDIPEEAYEDVVYYLTDGLVSADDIVYTIDGIDVSAAYYFYWITYEAYLYSLAYYNAYYVYPEITQEFSDGTTMAEYVMTSAYNYMLSYVCAYARAVADGVELSGDYLDEYETYYSDSVTELGEEVWDSAVSAGTLSEDDYTDEEKAAIVEVYGQTQMAYYLMYYSTTADGIDSLYYYTNYFNQYRDYLFLDGGEYALTDEEIDEYISTYDIYSCRYIFFGDDTSTSISDEEFEEYEAQALACYEELSALSGDELDEAIAGYTAENSDGNTTGEVCFSSSSSLVDGIIDLVETLEIGQIGMTEQTDNGYYVIIRDEITRDTIITELEYSVEVSASETAFETMVLEWIDEADVTDYGLMDDFDIYTFYENLETLRDLIDAVN